jgi:shikimate dehydrogenase
MVTNNKKRFGLLGRNISYSFSRGYFKEKFKKENLQDCSYENFDLAEITLFPDIIKNSPNEIKGVNVTIPYKQEVMPYLDKLSKKAAKIGAVNTIKITKDGQLKGYNTDYYGFKKSLEPLLQKHHKKALILGTGGASKAVAFALEELGIDYQFVARGNKPNTIEYSAVDQHLFDEYHIIINCTPLGTSPNFEDCPPIAYEFFSNKHIAYDLIYNPAETQFMKNAKQKGAQTKNGLSMLELQAEKSWEIWNR